MKLNEVLKKYNVQQKLQNPLGIEFYNDAARGPSGGRVFMKYTKTNNYVECWIEDEKGNYDLNDLTTVKMSYSSGFTADEAKNIKVNHGGFSDWRLPTEDELITLYNLQQKIQPLKEDDYWIINNGEIMFFDFNGYTSSNLYTPSALCQIRLVRDL